MTLRQITLDTETTGLSPKQGHRVIEIGCLELLDRRLTGEQFHIYLNPEREIDAGAQAVHGITSEFLADKPKFEEILSDFLTFIEGAELIIHNAPFDVGFINAELKRAKHKSMLEHYSTVTDTLVLAKNKHPGLKNNLDALCKRYQVSNSHRTLHGALLDAELLAFVYLGMTGGQGHLFDATASPLAATQPIEEPNELCSSSPVIKANPEELEKHKTFIEWIETKSGVELWTED